MCFFFFFKQKTAYEVRISDWSSDVCSSDLGQQCRYVDCDACFQSGTLPCLQILQRPLHHIKSQVHDLAAFLQYRNKGIWRDQAPRRVIPSDQCFSRDDMIGMETVFGLIDYPNVPGGEGSVQFTCDRQTPIAFPVEFIAIPFPTLAARHGTIAGQQSAAHQIDRKSTRLNSSHYCATRL